MNSIAIKNGVVEVGEHERRDEITISSRRSRIRVSVTENGIICVTDLNGERRTMVADIDDEMAAIAEGSE